MIFDKLWLMKWRRNRYVNKTTRKIKNLRRQKKYTDANELSHDMHYELKLWQEAIWVRHTQTLVASAERLDIPVSYEDVLWGTSEEQDNYLTSKARYELSRAIRQEKKERLEHRMRWVKDVLIPILSALSVIGSLIVAYTALKLKH